MLVLSRYTYQSILIGNNIRITILRTDGDQVRIGIAAPQDVPIMREEIVPRYTDITEHAR